MSSILFSSVIYGVQAALDASVPLRCRTSAVLLSISLSIGLASALPAAGLYRDGATARSMALGGSSIAGSHSPLDALTSNPANLIIDRPTLELNAAAGFARGSFDNRANRSARFTDEGLLGGIALAIPAGPLRFALGVNPDIALRTSWRYRDTPGGADGVTSYGVRGHESEILLLRTSLGVSWAVTPRFSLGASASLLYNENRLQSPYIFQSQQVLRTVKTLLDLQTEGYGWNAQFGLAWKPLETLQFGLSYTTEARVESEGRAHGDANVQLKNLGLGAARSDFSYDAAVENVFPQQVSAGLAWQATRKLSLTTQVDWIGWEDAFDVLEVRLTNGNNRDLNGLAGSDALDDDIPLDWKDQFVFRVGAEYALDKRWTVRAGYSYGRNPVPSRTLTPLTAAILEHTLSTGVGFRQGRVTVDLGYQWQIPNRERIDTSDLAAGEYARSEIRIGTHWVGLTTAVEF